MTTPSSDPSDDEEEEVTPTRGIRHRDIIDPDKVSQVSVLIVGVGAIGSHVAKQLAHIEVGQLWLVDFDTVDIENLGVQGFNEDDLGNLKVEAVAAACRRIFGDINIDIHAEKFKTADMESLKADDDHKALIVSCVDSMKVRREIWEAYKAEFKNNENALFIDSRMAAETARVLAVRGTEEEEYYEKSVFDDSDGLPMSCTSKATIYCANIAAGMVTAAFTKWLRGMCPDRDVLFNIFASQVTYDSEDLVY